MRTKTLLAWLAASTMLAAPLAAETELTVYTAVEAEDLARYAETFNADHPDIKINWVRDSTGIVTAKLLAETRQPAGRRDLGPGRDLAAAAEVRGHARALCPGRRREPGPEIRR